MWTIFLSGVGGAVLGAFVTTLTHKYNVTWEKRRDTMMDAYAAVVDVNNALVATYKLAHRIESEARQTGDHHAVAHSSDWNITSSINATRSRLERLRNAKLNIRAVWGEEAGDLFDRYFDLAAGWQNAFATFADLINGVNEFDDPWDASVPDYDYLGIITKKQEAERFFSELQKLVDWIKRFARSAGVVVDVLGLPLGAREALDEFREARERRQLAAPVRAPPAKSE